MFGAAHRGQESGDFLRARDNGEGGWDVVFDNPRLFEGDGIDKPECSHGDRNRTGRQSSLLDQVNLPRPDLVLAQQFGRPAEMAAGKPARRKLAVCAARGYGSAYPQSCGGEAGSLATPLRNGQRHMAPPHRLAVELSG